MKSYCLKCRKNTENINAIVSTTRMIEQWYYQNVQYVIVKNQDLLKKGLLSNLDVRTPLSKVPILGVIAYTKKYLHSDWLRGVQYWPYLFSVFNICAL